MREAIGGTWILYMAITIIIAYVVFMGFVMNYASAYRAANYVITEIENCQGQIDKCGDPKLMETITQNVKNKYGYIPPNNKPISPMCISNGSGAIYRVSLPVMFQAPIVGDITWWEVKVETKTIIGAKCG